MCLVDSSVWIDHLRGDSTALALAAMLLEDAVVTHPFVVGELALGNLGTAARRGGVLADLALLEQAKFATNDEVLALVESESLWSRGIGWVDAHLLAAARLSGVSLWTHDRRLRDIAEAIGVGHG